MGFYAKFIMISNCRIETHVVEFSGDLYDRMITVRIYQRLRDEHKFASLEEVKAQVMKDQEKAMAYFKEHHIWWRCIKDAQGSLQKKNWNRILR